MMRPTSPTPFSDRMPVVGSIVSNPAFSSMVVKQSYHAWWPGMLDRLTVLCELPAGWDGYNAPPVSFLNAHFAVRMLEAACQLGVPMPQIIPGVNGDLQVEWHTATADVELHIRAPNDVAAWRFSPSTTDDGDEINLAADFKIVAGWLDELVETPIAARSAAA